MMTSHFIASDILKKLCEDHTTPIKHLISMIKSKYQGFLLQGMGCETKGDWEDVWELGRVLPEVAKVANDIY